MVSKTDISAFKPKAKKEDLILQGSAPSKRGRKAKPASEKASETIAIRLTKSEKEALEKNAGLVALGTYLKHLLKKETDAFK